jgi:3-deoxy-manno-octulosonate cytidylyltransferase (CMP-KDO synthetase)
VKALAVIPARLGAVRFPGKPLADLGGRPVIEWVYRAAASCEAIDEVVVATDDRTIVDAVERFGGAAEMTRTDHATGTDRVAEVAERTPAADLVVNVQGDQPFATAEMLTALVSPYLAGERPAMATLACPLAPDASADDPNVVKVVRDLNRRALYFSRSRIPFQRGGEPVSVLHHLGLYAFTRETLLRYAALPPTPLERAESLEQLRALEHGIEIHVADAAAPVHEINTPEDLDRARALLAQRAAP